MNNHAKKVGVFGIHAGPRNRTGTGSPRACRGEVDWLFLIAIAAVLVGATITIAGANSKPAWEVQVLPVEDDGVKCYILTTPKGAVDLECLPYHYEGEENQDEYETRV